MGWKKYRNRAILAVLIAAVLAVAFWYGGNAPDSRGWGVPDGSSAPSAPSGHPLPVEPESMSIGSAEFTCSLSVSCATILDNMQLLNTEKRELVPVGGWVLQAVAVPFREGESVFQALQRTLYGRGIHLEFKNTPLYNAAYIEGIHNLYEFDVGELSGWVYRVNGWFPNYGCSRYQLRDGDVVEFLYTCDLGVDVGGGFVAEEQQ